MSTLKISYSAEMMTNYLQAELISPQAKFEALQSADGHSLLFSVGTDGVLYLIADDSGESTAGWTKTDLSTSQINKDFPGQSGIVCKTFDADQSVVNGTISLAMVLHTPNGDKLYLSLGNSHENTSWSKTVNWVLYDFDVPGISLADLEIVNVFFCETTGKEQYIIVDTLRDPKSPVNDLTRFYITAARDSGSFWHKHDLPIDVEAATYQTALGRAVKGYVDGMYTSGRSGDSGQLVFTPVVNVFGDGPPTTVKLNLPGGVVPDSIASTRNPDLSTDLFVVSGNKLFYFSSSNQSNMATASLLIENELFSGTSKLLGIRQGQTITLWGKNGSDQVFYLSVDASNAAQGDQWSHPTPILFGIEEISTFINLEDGGNTIFASGNGVLQKITQDTKSPTKLWQTNLITLPVPPKAPSISFNSYTTTISLSDENDLPAIQAQVSISANRRTAVYINGLYYVLDANSPAHISANAMGMITIVEASGTLVGTIFKLSTGGGQVEINPMDAQFKKLAQLGDSTGDTAKLKGAKIDLGSGNSRPLILGNPSDSDLKTVAVGLSNLKTSYDSLNAPKLQAFAAFAMPVPHAYHSFGDDILLAAGDLFRWLESGVEAIISIVKDAASSVWHFIAEIGGKVYRAILNAVDAVVGAVEWVFNAIKTAIEDLIKYLSFLFEWEDIKRTKEVLHNLIKCWLKGEVNGLQTLKTEFDQMINTAEGKINEWAGITDWSPLGDKMSQKPAKSTSNPSNNQNSGSLHLTHHFQNNAGNISTIGDSPVIDLLESLINDLLSAIEQEADVLGAAFDQLKKLVNDFSTLTGVQIIQRVIAILVDTLLSSVQVVVDALLNILTDIGNAIIEILDTKIHIPVISDILNAIGIPDISMLDLMCWITGTAFTVVYKIAKGAAPFSDDMYTDFLIHADSIDQLQQAFQGTAVRSFKKINAKPMIQAQADGDTEGPISMPHAVQETVFLLGHSVGTITIFISVFVNSLEAEIIPPAKNPFAIPSAVLGIVSGGSIGISNFLVPRDPIQNKIFSYLASGTTGVRVISKIMFSSYLQKKFEASTKLSFLAAGDGRATGAAIDALLVFPGVIATIWHLVELMQEKPDYVLADAVLDELSNITSYVARIAYALAVNDEEEESRNILILVMAGATLITSGLQAAEVVVEGISIA
ncbi:hypothetical protein D0X99_17525 [Algoriphagus lacus]|uniref:Uncharacterized protein n=1 Tax=Algoriphagus lacus TaxID=2056311 RepID=A0A418PMG3_9BACT|nr:hypothetical protein [Algoriphagus lacus]RIW12899.1 hypothetical protein D0X99_17525 [Algoriphagus lacus]